MEPQVIGSADLNGQKMETRKVAREGSLWWILPRDIKD